MAAPSVVNVASSDAQCDTSQKELTIEAKPSVPQPPKQQKRKRFDTREMGKRHGGTSYTKSEPSTSLHIVPRRKVFPVFTSNLGCRTLARYCYQAIQGRDFRLANSLTETQLAYMLTISYCNRLVQCSLNYGYAFPEDASRLKQVANGIQLPAVLAQYVESIGPVEMACGATVVPYVDSYHQLFSDADLTLDPARLLWESRRPIPPRDWALDLDWIVEYNDATTRASRSGMRFRCVNNQELVGRLEMLVSVEIQPDGMYLPKAPQIMTEAEAQLGACYYFRNYKDLPTWPGSNKALLFDAFVAIPMEPQIVFSDLCVNAFRGAQLSVD